MMIRKKKATNFMENPGSIYNIGIAVLGATALFGVIYFMRKREG